MLSFKSFIALFEDKLDFAAEQYKAKLLSAFAADGSPDSFKQDLEDETSIVKYLADKIDPTKKKVYVLWLARMYSTKAFKLEDTGKIRSSIELFDKAKAKIENKDLNSYKSLSQLYTVLEPFENAEPEDLESKTQKEKSVKKDATVFIDEPDFKVIIPKSQAAACVYGSGTKWCTAADKDNMFDHYAKDGELFIVMAKIGGQQRKFQIHYESESFMDEKDEAISKKDISALSKIPGYTKFLNKMIAKHYAPHIPAIS